VTTHEIIEELRVENEALRRRVDELEHHFKRTARLPLDWGLTPKEEAVLNTLATGETLPLAKIAVLTGIKRPDTVKVHLTRIRKRVERRKVIIERLGLRGYRLTDASREIVLKAQIAT
jgi:DNA-binding CsgD family transcriptional regulator